MIQSIAIVKALSRSKVNIISRLKITTCKGINSKKNKSEDIVSKSTFVIRMETCTVAKKDGNTTRVHVEQPSPKGCFAARNFLFG